MKKFIAFIQILTLGLVQMIPLVSVLAVDDVYKLSEVYTPASREIEESRRICFYPFRNAKNANSTETSGSEFSSDDYLSRGVPAILVTEIRKMGVVYDESVVTDIHRHQMGTKPKSKSTQKKSSFRDLEGGGLNQKNLRRREYTDEEWEGIQNGKIELKPAVDPRYIPLDVVFFRESKLSPLAEEAIDLGHKNKCFYVVTGEYRRIGSDELVSEFELSFLWDGKVVKRNHKTSFIRAFQELKPLGVKLKESLVQKDFSTVSIETGSRSGALVFIDGVYVGKTPIRNYPVTIGKHEILITEKDHEEIQRDIYLEKHKTKKFNYTLKPLPRKSYISVTSNPPGAEVYLGIERLGETPLKKVKVPVGKNRLRVSKEDHIDYFTGVDLKDGIHHSFSTNLREGDSDIYYKNKDYLFLDYTYKDFAVYSLYGTLLFYAGHIYYQMRANSIYDSVKPQSYIFETLSAMESGNGNSDLAGQYLFANEIYIQQTYRKGDRYQNIAGNLGLQRLDSQSTFKPGPMLYGMAFMVITSFTFFFMGLDEETFDIGFQPGQKMPGISERNLQSSSGFFGGEAGGHIMYRIRF